MAMGNLIIIGLDRTNMDLRKGNIFCKIWGFVLALISSREKSELVNVVYLDIQQSFDKVTNKNG